MTKFTFTVESDNGDEIAYIVNRIFPAGGAEPDIGPKDEAPKRTRRTKEQIAADVAAEQQSSTTQSSAPPVAEVEDDLGLDDEAPVTLEMVKAAGQDVITKHNAGKVKEILAPFGASRFGDIKPEDFGKVHAALLAAA